MMAESSRPKSWIVRKLSGKKNHKKDVRGPLNSVERLKHIYANILEAKDVGEDMKKVFQTLRIAVFGRSGSGKSTVIGLMMGDTGPRSISEGTAGTQDIDHEWHSPKPDLPIIIHDSDGIDTRGQDRVDTIKKFLDKHRSSSKFSDRIHLIWYVISAADSRFLDDGDLMKIVSESGIPMQLVMTFNDWKDAVAQNVTERNLDRLLSDVKQKEEVKKRMVRMGSKVHVDDDNKLRGQIDLKGLRLLSKRTAEHMDKRLRYTWVASQAVDADGKLGKCAKLIVNYKRAAIFTSIAALPVANEIKLYIMFQRILECLCRIWGVPPNFKKALIKNVLMKEGAICLLQNLLMDMATAAGLALTVVATVATSGLAAPAVVFAWLTAFGVAVNSKRGTSVLLTSYSLIILGSILYVTSIQVPENERDAIKSVDDYTRFCEEFAHSEYEQKLKKLAQRSHSTWNTMMWSKKERGKIKAEIIEFFGQLVLKRPNSLYTLLHNADDSESSDQNTTADEDSRESEKYSTHEQPNGDDSSDGDDDDTREITEDV